MSTPFPASLLTKIKRFKLDLNELTATQESAFTRTRQTVSVSGGTADRWEGVIELIPLADVLSTGATYDLRTWWGWLVAVGMYGDFTIGDPDYTGPQSGLSPGLVNGAGQTGRSLTCDGVTPSVTVLRAGEYFQVGTEFKVVTADCASNGAGQFTINFKPSLRVSPADNAALTFASPQLLAKLTTVPSKDTDSMKFAAPSISFEESL